jgi:thymidylate synthase (FAD)
MDFQIQFKSTIDIEYVQHMGDDETIAHAAWVSTRGNKDRNLQESQRKNQGVVGLINYLMKHRHGTPFEHGGVTFVITAPIFVWREWHRHRIGWSYNEESARYKTLDPVFYVPNRCRPMMKVDDWRPGRPKFATLERYFDDPETEDSVYTQLCENLEDDYRRSYEHYLENLNLGIDPGLARDGLPVGIYSSCYVTCNPRSLMAFLSLRTHRPDATVVSYPLYEIEQAADALEMEFNRLWPTTWSAWNANGRVAP